MTANERNRKKIRISIIDVLIVITVIACAVGAFLHYRIYEKNNEVIKDDVALVSVMLYNVENSISTKIAVGDKIYLTENNELLGTVAEVSSKDGTYYFTDDQGLVREGVDFYSKDVSVIITVNGEFTEEGFLENGVKYIAAGMEIDLYSADFCQKGLIYGIENQSE